MGESQSYTNVTVQLHFNEEVEVPNLSTVPRDSQQQVWFLFLHLFSPYVHTVAFSLPPSLSPSLFSALRTISWCFFMAVSKFFHLHTQKTSLMSKL